MALSAKTEAYKEIATNRFRGQFGELEQVQGFLE